MLLSLALASGCSACGGGSTGPPEGAGAASGGGAGGSASTTSGSGADNSSSTSTSSGGSGPCPPLEPPASVPAGWVEYGDWSCDCRFYLPPSEELLPPPIAWEPCPVAPQGVDCRRMVSDWTDGKFPVSLGNSLWVDDNGTPLIMFRQISDDHLLNLIAEVDGRVRFAFLQARDPTLGNHQPCGVQLGQVNENKYVLQVEGDGIHGDWTDTPYVGALGGTLGQLRPDVLVRYDDGSHNTWVASSSFTVRGSMPGFLLEALSWSGPPGTVISSAALDPENHALGQLVAIGDAVFFDSGGVYQHGINVWDPIHGARPFVRWIGDWTKGAGDLGSDGIDLVWSYGEGKQPSEMGNPYPVQSVMTAPYTTDPDQLEPRRLRSYPGSGIGAWQWSVGCGYAANEGAGDDIMLVVRLSDGVSWLVPGSLGFVPQPFGVTCEEVFSLGTMGDELTISRIRLDSLGPGIPPD